MIFILNITLFEHTNILQKQTTLLQVKNIFTFFILSFGFSWNLHAQDPLIPRFETDVAPILIENCIKCHGKNIQQGGLDLTTRNSLLVGGNSGPAIVPQSPQNSLLLQKTTSGAMPLGEKKLSSKKIELIHNWIEDGALSEGEDQKMLKNSKVNPRQIMVGILNLKCLLCHGRRHQKGGLDIRTRESLLRGGVSGPAIVPGKPEESLLMKRIMNEEMPPQEHQARLSYRPITSAELEQLSSWISSEAPFDKEIPLSVDSANDPLVTKEDRKHWSFQPPKKPSIPIIHEQKKIRTPIDAFLLKKLKEKGLTFSPEADPQILMRRAYFDVTGLPPTSDEVEAYLTDKNPRAYENLVNRLLESPHYGEHWGRRWLDAAGYADSEGQVDFDAIRPHAWRYRDWVIRAFQNDKPYDQFLTEQIAGDELFDYKKDGSTLKPEALDALIATGFMRMAPDGTYSTSQAFVPERLTVVADQLETLTSTIMGLTMGCARCHDHKYDPIPQRDYYRFSAILRSSYDPYDWLSPNKRGVGPDNDWNDSNTRLISGLPQEEIDQIKRFNAHINQEIKILEDNLKTLATPFIKEILPKRWAKVPAEIQADLRMALNTPTKKQSQTQKYLIKHFGKGLDIFPIKIKDFLGSEISKEISEKSGDYEKKVSEIDTKFKQAKKKLIASPRIRALFDMHGKPTPVHILFRGEHFTPGSPVEPGVPSALSSDIKPYRILKPFDKNGTTGRRLALAKWLVQPNHPLTARVIVNRIWQHYFNRGIVESSGNFGLTGSPPSHPNLLDWLSNEFSTKGWSLKLLHRIILNSTAYRQRSHYIETIHSQDPENILLSRFPLRRLDADAIRDSILAVSGRLNRKPYGPPDDIEIQPNGEIVAKNLPTGQRRSIYLLQRRSQPVTILEAFDAPQLRPNCLRRTHSTVSSQALQLMNSKEIRSHSRYMAGRIIDEVGTNPEKMVERVYITTLGRWPTEKEKINAVDTVIKMTEEWNQSVKTKFTLEPSKMKSTWLSLATFCHTMLNSAEFLHID